MKKEFKKPLVEVIKYADTICDGMKFASGTQEIPDEAKQGVVTPLKGTNPAKAATPQIAPKKMDF